MTEIEFDDEVYRPRFFAKSELMCSCGCGLGALWADFDSPHLRKLDLIREAVGRPLRPTSGIRCEPHNAAVGGKPTSEHLHGLATDIAFDSDELRFLILRAAFSLGIQRIGLGHGFIHIGSGTSPRWPAPRTWDYGGGS